MKRFVIKGDICFNRTAEEITTHENAYLVCKDGVSAGVFPSLPQEFSCYPLLDFTGKLVLPGLVDLHVHAPQFSYRGTGMDFELMDWLQRYAFPEESKYADLDYADKAYTLFAAAMKESATTRASVFASRHREATLLLMDKMEQTGLISMVGKVNMDRDAPDPLREPSARQSEEDTSRWIEEVLKKNYENTFPILTPRFLPSCTDELMEGLERVRRRYSLPVQSHLSENPSEIAYVHALRPDISYYGEGYDKASLFGKDRVTGEAVKTLMAHCVYSGEKEIERMKEQGVFIVHCPSSNLNVCSGIAPVKKYLKAGMKVGIGSDVAGGESLSLFCAIKAAVQSSKMYKRYVDGTCEPLTIDEGLYLATKGGGEFFGKVGSFESGYELDAIVLDDGILPHPQPMSIKERLERAVYLNLDEKGLRAKFVKGNRIL